jgi:hypothetical protein
MLPELLATAAAFATGDVFLTALVGDFTAQDWLVRDSAGHDPRWIVGHLATYRRRVLAMAGLPAEPEPWEAAYVRGSSPADLPAELDLAPVLAAFHGAQALLEARWEALTPEQLAAPFGRKMPNGSETVGGAIQFMAWHEAYHLGQLGLLRRMAGRPGRA